MAKKDRQRPGIGVDSRGNATIDPSENVKALNEASVKALADLASLRAKYDIRLIDQRNRYDEKLDKQRRYYDDKLRDADKELRKAESDRIDAIRAVDVGNVQRAAEVAAAAAEALRSTVAVAAQAASTNLAAALDPIQKDIADLRRAQYEAQGQKTQVVDQRGGNTLLVQFATVAVAVGAVVTAIVVAIIQ